jgi:hypothetical protein
MPETELNGRMYCDAHGHETPCFECEPGPEEGGEDVYGLPEKCVRWPCEGSVEKSGRLYKCVACGTSYGSDD